MEQIPIVVNSEIYQTMDPRAPFLNCFFLLEVSRKMLSSSPFSVSFLEAIIVLVC